MPRLTARREAPATREEAGLKASSRTGRATLGASCAHFALSQWFASCRNVCPDGANTSSYRESRRACAAGGWVFVRCSNHLHHCLLSLSSVVYRENGRQNPDIYFYLFFVTFGEEAVSGTKQLRWGWYS